MELSKNFDFQAAEIYWDKHWTDKQYFKSQPNDKQPYTIVMPPPNVTGILHMGHCLNNTIQDILIRRARMEGKNACWVPGTDHASIATEAKVVAMLREKNILKAQLSREEFLAYAWEWKMKYGDIILHQLRKMGCSCDWDRTTFTMDEDYYQSVVEIFNQLYEKGWIYRGKRMINWDTKALTALSDEEVVRKETQQFLYYINYPLVNADGSALGQSITIATVRPETIMGDTAIAIHPKDERYLDLHGKYALIPIINKKIPIITDEYVLTDFGTGALKVTPAHDLNDYNLGIKHHLEIVDILTEDGKISPAAQILIGEDRFEARKKIVEWLEKENYLIKKETYTSEIGYSERTDTVVEPRLSMQWWVDMKKLNQPALEAVLNNTIAFHPEKFKNTYAYWMENIRDWCISRQLWWGHRIPAWYDKAGNVYVAKNIEEALKAAQQKYPTLGIEDLKQDEDCLDTWFSSWLWPIEVFKGISQPNNKEIEYYYPTQTLVTAPEIIFFWVARMIMAGYAIKAELPFENVYFTGIVRDKEGRKMSKSLGNSPDLLKMIDEYGADAVRFGIMIASPAGNDLLWDNALNEQGKFFINKLWNALRLIKTWNERQAETLNIMPSEQFAIFYFEEKLNQTAIQVGAAIQQFKLSEALKILYTLFWDDFCSWYLEWIKPLPNQALSVAAYQKTIEFYDAILQLLHPFIPFVTEAIYHQLAPRNQDLCVLPLPTWTKENQDKIEKGNYLKQVITQLREARIKNNIPNKTPLNINIETQQAEVYQAFEPLLKKQLNIESLTYNQPHPTHTIIVPIEQDKLHILSTETIDTIELKRSLEKELLYQENFLASVLKKLNNEKFVQNAKADVIDLERKKQYDAEQRIKTLKESLTHL